MSAIYDFLLQNIRISIKILLFNVTKGQMTISQYWSLQWLGIDQS